MSKKYWCYFQLKDLETEVKELRQTQAELESREQESKRQLESLGHQLTTTQETLREKEVGVATIKTTIIGREVWFLLLLLQVKEMLEEERRVKETERVTEMVKEKEIREREIQIEMASDARSLQAQQHQVQLAEEKVSL